MIEQFRIDDQKHVKLFCKKQSKAIEKIAKSTKNLLQENMPNLIEVKKYQTVIGIHTKQIGY